MKSTNVSFLLKVTFPNANIQVGDSDYALPKAEWLTGTFFEFFNGWRFDHNLNEWSNKNDCDNASSLFFCFSQICHAKGDRPEQAVAVGELFYKIGGDQAKGHAVNVAITDKGVITIEPQTGVSKPMTKEEKDSVWFIRI